MSSNLDQVDKGRVRTAFAGRVTPFLAATVVKIALGTALACGMPPRGDGPAG